MVRDPEWLIYFYVLCATSAFTHGRSYQKDFRREQQQPVERLSAVLIPGVLILCVLFFSFLELFLVTLLHGKVFFFLQRKGKFKESQQLKETMENSPK